LRVNGLRLRQALEEMARIGGTPSGGVQRLTLTEEDRRARDLFVNWLRDLMLEVTIDEMGNIFGTRAGRKMRTFPPSWQYPTWTHNQRVSGAGHDASCMNQISAPRP